jgi:hypothetical protein
MCVSCLVVSALTFFIPVSDVPASNIPQSASTSASTALVKPKVSPGIAAVQKEIQAVLAQLPKSTDAEVKKAPNAQKIVEILLDIRDRADA